MDTRRTLRSFLCSTTVGVVVRNRRGRIIFANHAACDLMGIARQQFRGEHPVQNLGVRLLDANGAEVDWSESPFEIVTKHKVPLVNHHYGVRSADGTIRWFVGTYFPVLDANGEARSVIACFNERLRHRQEGLSHALQQTALQTVMGIRLSLQGLLDENVPADELRDHIRWAVAALNQAGSEIRAICRQLNKPA